MLVDEETVMLEAGVEMRLEAKIDNDVVVMAIDVRIHTVKSLEQLSQGRGEVLGKRNT